MRPVDADVLLKTIAPVIGPGGKLYDPDIPAADMREFIREMPTLDIGVEEWLRKKINEYSLNLHSTKLAAVLEVFNLWTKENGG